MERQRAVQEAEYIFPYHYLDLESDRHKYIDFVPMISRIRLVIERLGDVRGLNILDAGCGDGRFCYELRDSGANLVGVDYCEPAIRFARAFVPQVEFQCTDVAALDRAGTFDRVVLIETLEHVPPAEIPAFLGQLAAALKPDGRLIVTVPSKRLPIGDKHYQHFDEASIRATLASHFEVTEVSGYAVAPDLRFRLRKRLAKLTYPQRRKSGSLAHLVKSYPDWYHAHYGQGRPEDCNGVIAVATPKRQTSQPMATQAREAVGQGAAS